MHNKKALSIVIFCVVESSVFCPGTQAGCNATPPTNLPLFIEDEDIEDLLMSPQYDQEPTDVEEGYGDSESNNIC